jgi:hypothetical protein
MMDSATFDIDRAPLSESGENGLEDSDHFNNKESGVTQTNELCSTADGSISADGTPCASHVIDEPVGEGKHFRIYSSFGQPIFGGSLYGELPAKSEIDTGSSIRLDVGIQSQTLGGE